MHNLSRSNFLRYLACLVLAFSCLSAHAATFYVATDGSDAADGSSSKPFLTISHGLSKLSSGDTLIVKDGVYNGLKNFINQYKTPFANGSSSQYTTIKAENPLEVKITSNTSLTYPDSMVRIDGSYVEVSGFVLEMKNTLYPPNQVELNGSHSKFTKSIVRREGIADSYSSWVRLGGDYNLAEDVAGVGTVRYGFSGGGTTATSKYNIFRRAIGRFDYTKSNQPKATFNHYGNNSGYGTHHFVYQNCISLDGNEVDYHGGTDGYKYGGFTSIKTAADDVYLGNIVLNEKVDISGFWLDGRDHILRDNIVWGIHKMPTYGKTTPTGLWGRGSLQPIIEASNFTVGNVVGAAVTNVPISNSNINPVDQQYLLRPNEGKSTGATVMKKIGVSGTLYGEEGWDSVTDENLWPWPYEQKIKEVFAIPSQPPADYTPTTNNTIRGFTVAKDIFGEEMTLTRYIWQYLGNQIPADIYGDNANSPAKAPSGFSGKVISNNP